jgi:chorismate mutase
MNEQLLLSHLRDVLARLEDTIIFALIERAQFLRNDIVYRPGAILDSRRGGESLVGYLLHETERIHARMRRYTSPDEHPFHRDLPAPALPALRYDENPLRPNTVNVNERLWRLYEAEVVPALCAPGDDSQYGSTAVCDVACLQALSRRVHFGKFVAESKYRAEPAPFAAAIRAGDAPRLLALVTSAAVEREVLDRVRRKAAAYGAGERADAAQRRIAPERVVDLYARWIIPLNKDVQVAYLLQRGSDETGGAVGP